MVRAVVVVAVVVLAVRAEGVARVEVWGGAAAATGDGYGGYDDSEWQEILLSIGFWPPFLRPALSFQSFVSPS